AVPLVSWLVLHVVTRDPAWIQDPQAYRLFMNAGHVLLYAAYSLSALVLYPVLYFRGASLPERVLGCYVTPLAYVLKEVIRVNQYFTVGESLYYVCTSIVAGGLLLQVGLIGGGELISRVLYRRRYGVAMRVVTWQPLVAVAVAAGALYVMLIWDGGVHYFYLFQEGYKLLFH
ncbi:MAG: hypothetical protein ACP5JJ_00060, partial [Anaerolineae bacterium]